MESSVSHSVTVMIFCDEKSTLVSVFFSSPLHFFSVLLLVFHFGFVAWFELLPKSPYK